jgi:hypothetical protein
MAALMRVNQSRAYAHVRMVVSIVAYVHRHIGEAEEFCRPMPRRWYTDLAATLS